MAAGSKPTTAKVPVSAACLEIEAMTAIQQTFDRLDTHIQLRVLAWANTVYGPNLPDGGPFTPFEDKYEVRGSHAGGNGTNDGASVSGGGAYIP
jgi:hypothetical protein